MDKFKDSMTFLFKEKNWWVKFLIPFILTFLLLGVSSLGNIGDTASRQPSSYNTYSNVRFNDSGEVVNAAIATAALIAFCLICFGSIPYILVSGWYSYESTQSGIQKRETEGIYGGNLGDKLKRALKYLAVSLIFAILISIFAIIFIAIWFVLGIILGGLSSNISSQPSALVYILFCCVSCIIGITFLVFYTLSYMVIFSAYLRLIATNTFSEAFKFSENWKLVVKYKGQFLGMILIITLGAIFIGVLQFFATLFALIFVLNPVIMYIASITGTYFITIFSTYFTYFFFPRYSGLLYREIIEQEESLKYIKID